MNVPKQQHEVDVFGKFHLKFHLEILLKTTEGHFTVESF